MRPRVAGTAWPCYAAVLQGCRTRACEHRSYLRPLTLKSMLNQRRVGRIFHALGDPTRRTLLERLSRGPASVSQLAGPLAVSLAAVVQHLQVLEESGVIRTEKVGRVRTCSIAPDGLRVAERWINERMSLWERRLDRLGLLLGEPETRESTNHRKKKP